MSICPNNLSTKLFFISFVAFLFSCQGESTSPVSGINISNPSTLDSVLNYYVDNDYYPFLYARLENLDGSLIYEHSAVNTDLLPETEIDKDSWIRVWSMSKIITISVAFDLIEDGLLSINDPVAKYIPEFESLQVAVSTDGKSLPAIPQEEIANSCPYQLVENDSVMTVLHLLNHEAGFYYALTGFPCLDSLAAAQKLPKATNSQELIDKLAQLPLIQHSGASYYYGTNTTVLGLVAERATGKSLKQLVEERVTTPLNIEGLQYGLPAGESLVPTFTGRDSILRNAVAGDLDIFGPGVPDYDPTHALYLGGEGMLATADGYADFARMLLNRGTLNGHRLLDQTTVEDIASPHTLTDNPHGYNGYNLWVSNDSMRILGNGDAGLWIGGGYENTHYWIDPKRDFVGVIMSQNHEVQEPGYEMGDKFRGALYQQIFKEED